MTRFYRSSLVIKIFCRAVCYILSQFRIIKFALKLNGPLGGGGGGGHRILIRVQGGAPNSDRSATQKTPPPNSDWGFRLGVHRILTGVQGVFTGNRQGGGVFLGGGAPNSDWVQGVYKIYPDQGSLNSRGGILFLSRIRVVPRRDPDR